MILNLYKEKGETPKECISRYKAEHPEYQDTPMTFAGRLDPIAEGVLPVLTGDDVFKKEEYIKKDKEYKAEILLGFSSDTYDILGVAQNVSQNEVSLSDIEKSLDLLTQQTVFPYPPYSSKTIDGEPLWKIAREGRIDGVDIPTREMKIYSYTIDSHDRRSNDEVLSYILDTIKQVRGDFRQTEISSRWHDLLVRDVQVLTVTFSVSSGTYIRTLAHELGNILNVGALILSLKRTKVGT